MPSPYDPDAFETRVNFAASVISSGRNTTRHFDTCFEMYDGAVVAEVLRRRAEKHPDSKLAANIWRYVSKDVTEGHAPEFAHLKRSQLPAEAAKIRTEARARFQQWMREHCPEQAEAR